MFYRFLGVSRGVDGVLSVRWANELKRARHLQRVGHTEVRFWDLSQPEHKEECMDQMLNLLDAGEVEFTQAERQAIRAEAQRLGFRLPATVCG